MLHCLHWRGLPGTTAPCTGRVGGHVYASAYPGPMGDVLSPLLWGIEAFPELPDACTLCGRGQEACPVRIPLPTFHRELRRSRPARSDEWRGSWPPRRPLPAFLPAGGGLLAAGASPTRVECAPARAPRGVGQLAERFRVPRPEPDAPRDWVGRAVKGGSR